MEEDEIKTVAGDGEETSKTQGTISSTESKTLEPQPQKSTRRSGGLTKLFRKKSSRKSRAKLSSSSLNACAAAAAASTSESEVVELSKSTEAVNTASNNSTFANWLQRQTNAVKKGSRGIIAKPWKRWTSTGLNTSNEEPSAPKLLSASNDQQLSSSQRQQNRALPPIPPPGANAAAVVPNGENLEDEDPEMINLGLDGMAFLPEDDEDSPRRGRNAADGTGQDDDFIGISRSPTEDGSSTALDFSASLERVKNCGWYWGPISGEAAERLLENEPDGSFVVRDSSDDHYIFSLTFKLNGDVRHVRIEHDHGNFSFGTFTKFKSHTIVDFIENAVEHSRSGRYLFFLHRRPTLGPMRVQLLHPVSRFKIVQSLQHQCRFVILKLVPRDLLHRLPVPGRIQEYLNTPFYYSERIADDAAAAEFVAPPYPNLEAEEAQEEESQEETHEEVAEAQEEITPQVEATENQAA